MQHTTRRTHIEHVLVPRLCAHAEAARQAWPDVSVWRLRHQLRIQRQEGRCMRPAHTPSSSHGRQARAAHTGVSAHVRRRLAVRAPNAQQAHRHMQTSACPARRTAGGIVRLGRQARNNAFHDRPKIWHSRRVSCCRRERRHHHSVRGACGRLLRACTTQQQRVVVLSAGALLCHTRVRRRGTRAHDTHARARATHTWW
jgi:hypothetical protein